MPTASVATRQVYWYVGRMGRRRAYFVSFMLLLFYGCGNESSEDSPRNRERDAGSDSSADHFVNDASNGEANDGGDASAAVDASWSADGGDADVFDANPFEDSRASEDAGDASGEDAGGTDAASLCISRTRRAPLPCAA